MIRGTFQGREEFRIGKRFIDRRYKDDTKWVHVADTKIFGILKGLDILIITFKMKDIEKVKKKWKTSENQRWCENPWEYQGRKGK